MRPATASRCPPSPALLARRIPSTATGMTIAMSASAASTSTSVKAVCADLTPGVEGIIGLHLIFQAVGVFNNPNRVVPAPAEANAFRAVFSDELIGRTADQ